MTFSTKYDKILWKGDENMFFLPKEEVPEGVGFTTFGLTHLIWLVSMALVAAAVVVVYRKSDKTK